MTDKKFRGLGMNPPSLLRKSDPSPPAVVSSSPDIPDEAVEAALIVLYPNVRKYNLSNAEAMQESVRAALVAAAPALTRQAVADAKRDAWADDPIVNEYVRQAVNQAVAAERERIATAICVCPHGKVRGHEHHHWSCPASRIARAEPGTDERTSHE